MCTPTEDAANMCTTPTEASSSASSANESVHRKKKSRIATAAHLDFTLGGACCGLFSHAYVHSLSVQELATVITSQTTQNLVGGFLSRIESYLIESCDGDLTRITNIDHLLKHLSSSYCIKKNKGADVQSLVGPRYPVMVFLHALMVIRQPQSILSDGAGGIGEREVALSEAAMKLIPQFHGLASNILAYGPQDVANVSSSNESEIFPAKSTENRSNSSASIEGPISRSIVPMSMMNDRSNMTSSTTTGVAPMSMIDFGGNVTSSAVTTGVPLMSMIYSGRNVFAAELAEFDATWCSYLHHLVLVEDQMIKNACKIEFVMLKKYQNSTDDDVEAANARAVCLQRKTILKRKILNLTGADGVLKMESALVRTYNRYQTAKYNHLSLTAANGCASSLKTANGFAIAGSKPEEGGTAVSEACDRKMLLKLKNVQTKKNPLKAVDAEKLINDLLHGEVPNVLTNCSVEEQIWNSFYEDVKKVPPKYERIIKKFSDIKSEFLNLIHNENSKQEVEGGMDVEIFSQFLKSGTDDPVYFRDLLEFALQLVLDLQVPERDDETMEGFSQLLTKLDSQIPFGEAAVMGIRFVHERIVALKSDATMLKLQDCINRGGGIKHLQIAFAKRFGNGKLPKTVKWLQSLQDNQNIQQMRVELEALRSPSNRGLKQFPILMKTGKRGHQKFGHLSRTHMYDEKRTLDWSSVRVQVGFGILDLVTRFSSMTEDNTPETLCLNVHRLTKARIEYVSIVSKATSLLVLSQVAASRGIVGTDLDDLLSEGKNLLDQIQFGPVAEIGAMFAEMCGIESDAEFVTGVLTRNLTSESAVFTRVRAGIALSLSAIALLGKGSEGMAIAVTSLHRVGASCLLDSVLKLGTAIDKLIFVTNSVHGAWYNACNVHSQE